MGCKNCKKIANERTLCVGLIALLDLRFGLFALLLFPVIWGAQKLFSLTAQAGDSLRDSQISINGRELSVKDKAKIPTRLLIMAIAYLGKCFSIVFVVYFFIAKQYKEGVISLLLFVSFIVVTARVKKNFWGDSAL